MAVSLTCTSALLGACGSSGSGSPAVVQSSIDIPTDGATALVVVTSGGQISVLSGPEGNVHLDITRRAPTEEEATVLAVSTSVVGEQVTAQWDGPAENDSVSFSVHAPPSMVTLAATTGGGNIDVEDRSGVVRLRTGGGEITTSNTTGTLSTSSGGGPIAIDRHTGTVQATTTAGQINISGALGGPSSATSTAGGNVTVTIPAGSRLAVSAETDHGVASNDFGFPVVTVQARQSFDGLLGDGTGGALYLQTTGGSVSLRASH